MRILLNVAFGASLFPLINICDWRPVRSCLSYSFLFADIYMCFPLYDRLSIYQSFKYSRPERLAGNLGKGTLTLTGGQVDRFRTASTQPPSIELERIRPPDISDSFGKCH